jgi:5-hydroxyisourate hydrolase-like protein (transthyretin family)
MSPLRLKGTLVMRLPVPAIISALLLCCACFCQRANSQTARTDSKATVSGKITLKGKPAPGVVVGLRSSEPAQFDPTFKATTDQDGKYRIAEVPQGKYVIAPVAPTFVIANVNNLAGQSVIVNEGENIEGIDFDLIRGGVITGKITDAEGHPIVEESVSLLSADYPRSGPSHHLWGSFQTDDRGIYRIFGIRPGRYRVSVGQESVYRGVGKGRRSLPIIFHPDARESAKATVIEVGEGTEAKKIDITISRAHEGFAVSGRVVDGETGKPVANVAISLSKIMIIDKNSTSGHGGVTDVRANAEGAFRLEKLPAGKYSISVEPSPESDLRSEEVAFDVIDQDVTGLLIKTSSGASLSGTVVIEGKGGPNTVGAKAPAWISVHLRNESQGFSSNQGVPIKPDGSFRVGGLSAGNVTFSVGTWGPTGNAKAITIARVERDGVVQLSGIQLQAAEHLSGLRIVAAYSSGSIRGVIKVENGVLPPTAHLGVSLSKVGDANNAQSEGGTAADARGNFLIEGLAAGTYELTVFAFIPEWRQRPRTAKQLVTVIDGSATDVMVTIDLTPPPIR